MICIVENVHTGDGGVLKLGDKVGGLSPEVLEILKSNKQIAKPERKRQRGKAPARKAGGSTQGASRLMRLFDYDPLSQTRTMFLPEDDGSFRLVTIADCQPVIDHNKALRNGEHNKKSEMWHAATIPPVVEIAWRNEGIRLDDPNCKDAIRKKLNSNEWSHLRTSEFTL